MEISKRFPLKRLIKSSFFTIDKVGELSEAFSETFPCDGLIGRIEIKLRADSDPKCFHFVFWIAGERIDKSVGDYCPYKDSLTIEKDIRFEKGDSITFEYTGTQVEDVKLWLKEIIK